MTIERTRLKRPCYMCLSAEAVCEDQNRPMCGKCYDAFVQGATFFFESVEGLDGKPIRTGRMVAVSKDTMSKLKSYERIKERQIWHLEPKIFEAEFGELLKKTDEEKDGAA